MTAIPKVPVKTPVKGPAGVNLAKTYRAAGAAFPGRPNVITVKGASLGDPVLETLHAQRNVAETAKIAEMLDALTSNEVPVVERAILDGMDPAAALTSVLEKRAQDPVNQFPEAYRNDLAVADAMGRWQAWRDVAARSDPNGLMKLGAAILASGNGPSTLEESAAMAAALYKQAGPWSGLTNLATKVVRFLVPKKILAGAAAPVTRTMRATARAGTKARLAARAAAPAVAAPAVAAPAAAPAATWGEALKKKWGEMPDWQKYLTTGGAGAVGGAGLAAGGHAIFSD